MNSLQRAARLFLQDIRLFLEGGPQVHPALALGSLRPTAGDNAADAKPRRASFLQDLKEGILAAVPTKRRSIERRMWRRIGMPQFQSAPRRDLKACVHCGRLHESHTICGHCYAKVRQESEAIQAAMAETFGWKPIEQDVVVRYQDDPPQDDNKQQANKNDKRRIVEVPRPRPKFFSDNLLAKGNHSS